MKHIILPIAACGAIGASLLLGGCAPRAQEPTATPAPSSPKPDTKADAGSKDATPAGRKITLGFAQVGAESGWRTANTESIKAEALKRGDNLQFVDGMQKQENQIKAIRDFIAQKVDAIAFSPVVETGWDPVLKEARDAKIPVVLSDRTIKTSDEQLYAAFVGSNFIEEGKKAGEWLAKKTGGKATILELQGSAGAAPANDRRKGFADEIAKFPDMKIVKSQTGEFTRAKGKEVMEAFLRTDEGKSATALFSHNDDMAIGAIQAIEAAGKKPGKDIIIVSVDGVKAAFDALKEGKINCTVECNPLLGPAIFELAHKIVAGEKVDRIKYSEEGVYDETNFMTVYDQRKY